MSLSIICHLCNENLCNAQIYKEMRVFSFAIYLPNYCHLFAKCQSSRLVFPYSFLSVLLSDNYGALLQQNVNMQSSL